MCTISTPIYSHCTWFTSFIHLWIPYSMRIIHSRDPNSLLSSYTGLLLTLDRQFKITRTSYQHLLSIMVWWQDFNFFAVDMCAAAILRDRLMILEMPWIPFVTWHVRFENLIYIIRSHFHTASIAVIALTSDSLIAFQSFLENGVIVVTTIAVSVLSTSNSWSWHYEIVLPANTRVTTLL